MIMGMPLIGWFASLLVGFVVGGLFFLTMRLQVEYVVQKQGPIWLMPVALYARILLVSIVLVVVAVNLPGEKIAAAMLAGTAGALVARVLVSRMIRATDRKEENDGAE